MQSRWNGAGFGMSSLPQIGRRLGVLLLAHSRDGRRRDGAGRGRPESRRVGAGRSGELGGNSGGGAGEC